MTAVSKKREFGAFRSRFPVLFRGQKKKCFVCPLKKSSIQVFDFEKDQSARAYFSEAFSSLGIFKSLRIMFADIPLYY